MKTTAIIPLRKGSKSIVNKNKKKILGRPLFTWVLGEAIASNLDEIYIYTDDESIINFVKNEYKWTTKVYVMVRSEKSATDEASTEFAMKEFSAKIQYNFDVLCLLQATSPLTTKEDINKSLEKLVNNKYDSCLSVVEYKRFFWNEEGVSINYDYNNRARRQDFKGTLVENGAVYVTTKSQFIHSGNRLGGNIGIVKMPEDTFTEVDEPDDLVVVEKLLLRRLKHKKKTPTSIKAVVLDVDGVFTNGNITYSIDGEFSKEYNMQDGMGIELLRESNLPIVVMTSEKSDIVGHRMNKLNIEHVYSGVKDKYSLLDHLLKDLNLKRNDVAYVGDDVNDLANLCSVGWGFCPANAMDEVKMESDVILTNRGGLKAIREVVRFILNYNQRF
ncbi:acylneuraminate cytidylyltransferase [Halobacillus sp. A1]|uniref:acylneuraminate cytidylyltransferase n=1 Tax=Halobacillus sp. A1 TaxID=2880262 RepID=UPI0020A6D80C|nr:acylneuraminate cytidylyltransferase [Halobacillus sp. A1]MCP3032736.1 acylneuraminate cytidylyltransferase [Halobacillus sp. A1]